MNRKRHIFPAFYFYPRPPRGGRRSRWSRGRGCRNFYPRPPRGGRQEFSSKWNVLSQFLSTPSARRATTRTLAACGLDRYFYPRPPRGGRRQSKSNWTHYNAFLSTPSARRATLAIGDGYVYLMISIHALREEGDDTAAASSRPLSDFYPRPPRGGRHGRCVQLLNQRIISIHALREEGDSITSEDLRCIRISIHALREEGDMAVASSSSTNVSFLSTPSARRATRLPPKISVVYAFLSTPSARRATCDFGLVPVVFLFLSTPSARRATVSGGAESSPERNFYPRPPRGGRPN